MNAEKFMRDIMAAFAQADLRPLLAALDEHVAWKTAYGMMGPVGSQLGHQGRLAAVEALSNLARDYTFQRVTPREVTAIGDIVWGIFETVVCPNRGGGMPVQFDMAIRWRLSDGKIVEHQAFYHTAALLDQLAK